MQDPDRPDSDSKVFWRTTALGTIFTTLIFVLGADCIVGQTNTWHGITPLKSRRMDVERQLGAGKEGTYYGDVDYERKRTT